MHTNWVSSPSLPVMSTTRIFPLRPHVHMQKTLLQRPKQRNPHFLLLLHLHKQRKKHLFHLLPRLFLVWVTRHFSIHRQKRYGVPRETGWTDHIMPHVGKQMAVPPKAVLVEIIIYKFMIVINGLNMFSSWMSKNSSSLL